MSDSLSPPMPLSRKMAIAATVVAVVLVAEFGYRFYDAYTSPEVAEDGMAFSGEPFQGPEASLSFAPGDTFTFVNIRVESENADESEKDLAWAGIHGSLNIDSSDGRSWKMPILLVAQKSGDIQRRSSVELGSELSDSDDGAGPVRIGVRYTIDYSCVPTGSGEETYGNFRRSTFRSGTRLDIRLSLQEPPAGTARFLINYSRAPRLLHERLLRSAP